MKSVYIAGPIRAYKPDGSIDWWRVKENMDYAQRIGWMLEQAGFDVTCPHDESWPKTVELILNTGKPGTPDVMATDKAKLARCDCVLFIGAWEASAGCKVEHDYAVSIGKPIFTDIRALLET